MELTEYLRLSEKTEKKFPNGIELTELQRKAIEGTFHWIKCAGDLADNLKRNIIYGKELELDVAEQALIDCCGLSVPESLTSHQIELLHHIIGANTEPAEAGAAVMEYLTTGNLDVVNLKEEGGDSQWYWAGAYRLLGTTFEEEADRNIAKLKQRFGDKFSEEAALNRNLDSERKVLEQA